MSNRVKGIIGIYKTLDLEEKKELTQRLFMIDPTPYEYVDMKHNQETVVTGEETIHYGSGTFVTKHQGSYERTGYYENAYVLDRRETEHENDAVLFEIDTETTNRYMVHENELDEDKFYYEFFGDGHAKLETIEKITEFGYKDGFFAESENYYYLLPTGVHIWKEAITTDMRFEGIDIYKIYEDNKPDDTWVQSYTNAYDSDGQE